MTIDKESKTITITSHIIFHGAYSNTKLAKQSAVDIENMWNKANGKVTIDNVQYSVKFKVTAEHRENLTQDIISKNKDWKNNFIEVENNTRATSRVYSKYDKDGNKAGANTGTWVLHQIKGAGTTIEAHEYGHLLTLDHLLGKTIRVLDPKTRKSYSGTDNRGEDMSVMLQPRSIVKKEYRKDPNAQLGFIGRDLPIPYHPGKKMDLYRGTQGVLLDEKKRRVTQRDIDNLGLDSNSQFEF